MNGKWRVQFAVFNTSNNRWMSWTSKYRLCCWNHAFNYATSLTRNPEDKTVARVYKER